jgi:hypothetical protein
MFDCDGSCFNNICDNASVSHTIWTVNQIVSLQEDFFGATGYLLFCLGVISIQSQGPP